MQELKVIQYQPNPKLKIQSDTMNFKNSGGLSIDFVKNDYNIYLIGT